MSDFQRSIVIPLYTLTHQEVKRFMRVPLQVLASPWISALLYIFIFGYVIGSQIDEVKGIPYMDFILPGLMLMQLMTAAFMEGSSGLYFKRFIKTIEEVLVAPIPNWMVIVSFLIAGIIRGLIVAAGILCVALFFSSTPLHNVPLLLGWASAVAVIFTLWGMLVGLWAKGFEQLNVFNVFVIMPLTYLGGVFYSIEMLPEQARLIVQVNPFFYFIDGIRYSMVGVSESNLVSGALIILVLNVVLFALVWWLFRIGYGIRE